MNWRNHITSDSMVCHGAPCLKGTRVMVSVVLDNLAAGRTPAQVLADYPTLWPDAIPAVIAYAAEVTRERVVEIPGVEAG